MSGYLSYALVSLGCILLINLALGLLFRKRLRQRHWSQRLSTADFIPILVAVSVGILAGSLIDPLMLGSVFSGKDGAGADAVSNAITATVTIWGFIWYKTRPDR